MSKPITPALEPAAARRLAGQLQMLEGDLLRTLVGRAEAWKVQADRKHEDLIRRAGAGANNLRRAVNAWDEALPALHRAIQAANGRLGAKPPVEVAADQPAAKPTKRRKAVDAKPADAKPADAKPAKPKALSGLDAAAQVLREAGEPMNAQDLVARILERGLWKTEGKTPAATIYAAMIREVRAKGSASRFQKVDRGRFAAAG
jgi:hypothetical protein